MAALEVLAEEGFSISRDSITEGLARVSWPGRLEIVSRNPLILVDGAHNPDAARRLRESLEQYFSFDRAILVIGTSNDKDIAGIVSQLAPLFNEVIVTCSHHPRPMTPALLAAEFARYEKEAQVAADVPSALARAISLAGDRDLICVAGSLFIVAEAMEWASKRDFTNRL